MARKSIRVKKAGTTPPVGIARDLDSVTGAFSVSTLAGSTGVAGNPLFFDDFNYAANTSNIGLNSSTDNPFVTVGGWTGMRSQDNFPWTIEVQGKLNGTLRTVTKSEFDTNTGTSAPWPGGASAYALRMACNNVPGGTNFYLSLDNGGPDLIPGNVYFQYWIYMNTNPSMGEVTAIESRHKMLYPYGSGNKWLYSHSALPYLDELGNGVIGNPSDGRAYFVNRDSTDPTEVIRWNSAPADNDDKLGANLGTQDDRIIPSNEWRCMRIHFDTSDSASGKFEVWTRRPNQSWVQIARWIGGVYPADFEWHSFAPGGHPTLRMPTTVGLTTRDDGIYYYLRDWAMAGSAADLPTYPDEP